MGKKASLLVLACIVFLIYLCRTSAYPLVEREAISLFESTNGQAMMNKEKDDSKSNSSNSKVNVVVLYLGIDTRSLTDIVISRSSDIKYQINIIIPNMHNNTVYTH